MPTYEYNCSKCERKFDIHQSFKDDALEVCPLPALNGKTNKAKEPVLCGGSVRKVFSSVGISFKGSGFYRNDSRPPDSSNSAKSDSANTDGANTGGSEEKPDKKSETKSETKSGRDGETAGKRKAKSDGKSQKSPKSQPQRKSGGSGQGKSTVNA